MSKFLIWMTAVVAIIAAGATILINSSQNNPDTISPDSGNRVPGFVDVAKEVGITFRMHFLPKEQGENFKVNLYDHGAGVAVADFDGDGFEDIYFANQLGRNALYRNRGDGTFEDVTERAGVGLGDRVCVGACFADTRNNGLLDLYVTSTRGGNVFFRNRGDGTFEDVTEKAGLACVRHSQTAVFFDFDNDGFLDLFVTNTAEWTRDNYDERAHYYPGAAQFVEMIGSKIEHNVLFRNNGDGTFTDVTEKSGLKGKGWGGDVAIFDYDEDGYLDLLVTNMFGQSHLYHNNGDGTFTDVTNTVLGKTSFGAIGAKVFDFNNDGKLDLMIVDMHSDMWATPSMSDYTDLRANEQKRYPKMSGPTYDKKGGIEREQAIADAFRINYDEIIFGNTLFKNLGNGKFEEVGDKAGIETFWPWGIATGDFNNDGFEDVFLPSGMGYPYFYWPNRLLMNNGNETFCERSREAGIEPPVGGKLLKEKIGYRSAARSSRCAAVGDFTNSGRLDLVVNNFNDHPYFFKNEFPKKNYVAFRLQGTKSNRDAVGAVVRITMGKDVMVRQVQAAGGYLSQSSKTVHFGLGDRPSIDKVEIRWPSGIRQTIDHPQINVFRTIVEPAN